MKYAAAVLAACVLATSGCAVTARVPQPHTVSNLSDIRPVQEFDWEAERVFQKREKSEKIDRLLKKIRGNGS